MTTVLIVAGEASGDVLGANLMQELKKAKKDIQFIGVGGEKMLEAGLKPLFPMQELAVMGVVEVLPKIPLILRRLKEIEAVIATEELAAVVTIDAQDFSKRVAQRARRVKPEMPRIHYVCPKVWAWREGRAKDYATLFDKILAVLPFEPPYFQQYDGDCVYVGHSILQRLGDYVPQAIAMPDEMRVGLMVGSRRSEIGRMWPVLRAVFMSLQREIPGLTAVVPLVREEDKALLYEVPEGVELVVGEARYAALQACRAVVSKSGTGNLELAVLGVPMVVGYNMHGLTFQLVKRLVKIPYISLVNWVAGRQIVPELIQDAFTVAKVLALLKPLLLDEPAWCAQAEALANVRQALVAAEAPPAAQAAREILALLR